MGWGDGSLRERRPGMWEIRVVVGVDPVSGRSVQRSFVFRGAREQAELRRRELAEEWAERRAVRRAAPFLTVGELLERWIDADHDWRPATWIDARSNVKALRVDPLAKRRVSTLTPSVVRSAMAAWTTAGASLSVVSGRFRVVRSALGWAHVERIVDVNPLAGMRGPTRPGTRAHLVHDDITRLLTAADRLVAEAALVEETSPWCAGLHRAEQVRLLVRLAADSGARRGELVALKWADLDGRVLTIERGVSAEQLGPTKTGRTRRLTLGRGTATMWEKSVTTWRRRVGGQAAFGEWLFCRTHAPHPAHRQRRERRLAIAPQSRAGGQLTLASTVCVWVELVGISSPMTR